MKKILLPVLFISSFVANAQFWTEKATGFTDADKTLNSISIVDADNVWANEFDTTTQDYTLKTFTRSTDGGETWTPGPINLDLTLGDGTSTGLGISSITAASATTAWVSAYHDTAGTGGIWKTTTSGSTWTKQTSTEFNDPTSYTDFVHFWDANNGVAVGDTVGNYFEIYYTSDGGTSWTPATSPTATDEYSYFNRYTVSGNSVWFGTTNGRIFRSVDKGLNWTVSTAPAGTDFAQDRFTFSDTNKGLLAKYTLDQPTVLYSTNDGGANWTLVTSSGTISKDHIAYIPLTSIVVSSQEKNTSNGGNSGSSYSTDDGVTWTTIDSGIFHGELAFLNSSFGFSAGLNFDATTGGIYKFSGIPLKTDSFDTNNQIVVYPNPTNGLLQINSKISLIKEATVFDLLGEKVYTSKFSTLNNNINLDLKTLQTGIYTLKVTSNTGKTENIKIIKN